MTTSTDTRYTQEGRPTITRDDAVRLVLAAAQDADRLTGDEYGTPAVDLLREALRRQEAADKAAGEALAGQCRDGSVLGDAIADLLTGGED